MPTVGKQLHVHNQLRFKIPGRLEAVPHWLAFPARGGGGRCGEEKGWSDLAAGRYGDIADENLDGFIGQLGAHAARAG
ncbi:hypothetical protein CVV67_00800 [Arthrobacter stackebrandtii]|nr:hypothetical protein CVV67_00800 [Arthrobacter stackebrandtii]